MTVGDFANAYPAPAGAADLIAEGDYVVGRWEGGGSHTGPAFSDFLIGSLPTFHPPREVSVALPSPSVAQRAYQA